MPSSAPGRSVEQARRERVPDATRTGPPHVAVIIVTWNRRQAVGDVIAAIVAQRFPVDRLDVVIVDNCSTDGTCEYLVRRWRPERVVENPTLSAHEPAFAMPSENGLPSRGNAAGFRSLTVVRNSHNLGGCGGFNTGFSYVERVLDAPDRAGRPDYVWLVDDDVDLPTDALAQLVRTADSDSGIGIVGSRAVDFHDRTTTIESTIYFDSERGRMDDTPTMSSPRYEDHQSWLRKVVATKGSGSGPFSGLREVDVVSACSLLARWSAVREIGFWDYRYFIYCDDADWCLRFARHGYRVVCDLDAVVYHTPWYQKLTPARLYYSQRNIVWLIQKTFPKWRLKYATFRWLASILNDCLQASFHRRIFHAEIIRRTAADIVANRGGRLDDDGPPKHDVVDGFRAIGALERGRTIVVLCSQDGAVSWADELRDAVERGGGSACSVRWVYVVRNDADPGDCDAGGPERVIYSSRLRSKLFRQVRFWFSPPRAVVVFNQTNDFPLLRGRFNVHVDRKWPTTVQIERDGFGPRVSFLARWTMTCLRSLWRSASIRPYVSPHRFG